MEASWSGSGPQNENPGRMPGGRGGSGVYEVNMAEGTPDVKRFSYRDDFLDELEASLSRERLGTYLHATGGDRERAIKLDAWNTAVSAAFCGPLQGLEVTLRNAIHRRLAERHGETWYEGPNAGLDRGAVERIARAKLELARDGHGNGPPRIVASLSFGFWVSLLGPGGRIDSARKANYEMTRWRSALRGTFTHCATLTRKEAHRPFNALRALRNRIAHHEPLFARNLARDHERIVQVLGWMTLGTRRWVEHHSRVPAVFDTARDSEEIRF